MKSTYLHHLETVLESEFVNVLIGYVSILPVAVVYKDGYVYAGLQKNKNMSSIGTVTFTLGYRKPFHIFNDSYIYARLQKTKKYVIYQDGCIVKSSFVISIKCSIYF